MPLPVLAAGAAGSIVASIAVTIVAYLAEAAKGIVGRVLIALGVGVVTSTGLTAVMNSLLAAGSVSTIGNAQVVAAMNGVGMTWFLSTIYAAITARMTLKGLTSDSVSFWVMRKRLPGA